MAPGPVDELALLDLERSNKGASKQRRDQINGEIGTMRDLLPLQESARQRLSQLQIMSLSCVYIRKCNILQKMLPTNRCSIEVPCEFSSSLTGFILVATRDGKLVYISENVTEYLGHSMVDMKTQGDSLFDIVDKRDHGTVQAQLLHGVTTSTSIDGHQRQNGDRKTSFFCRMNMSRTLKRQGGFGDVKVMHVKGHFVPVSPKEGGSGMGSGADQHVFIALCTPLITPDVKESLIQNNTTIFKSVHKLDMSFMELTETGEFHLGMDNSEIQNKSWYSMLHPEDLTEARAKHIQLIKSRHEMGCMMTVRMLTVTQEVIWVNIVMHVRQALLNNSDDPVIVCINQVVSEEEAKQFKIQGQLFALYAARAPDIFFGGHHYPQMPQGVEQETMSRPSTGQQLYMQHQQNFYCDQQRYQYGQQQQSQANHMAYQSQAPQYGVADANFESMVQRPQGHTSTIKALKRKLQENFISSCKPNKLPRLSHSPDGDNGCSDFTNGLGETQYMMNVNVLRNAPSFGQVFAGGNDVKSFSGGVLPIVYQAGRMDPVSALRQKKAMLVNAIAPIGTPEVVQKLAPTCKLEQVVPEVSIPDCYLTPDPSPTTSPKPQTETGAVIKHESSSEIKHLTTYVMGRLNELKESQTIAEVPSRPPHTAEEARRKNLPVIDATFVDAFFDDLVPYTPMEECIVSDIKTEPLSPPPQEHASAEMISPASSPSYIMTTKSPSPPPPTMPTLPIKEEITLEDCSDLEELLGLVGSAGSDQSMSRVSTTMEHCSPAGSPASMNGSLAESSPMSLHMTSYCSPLGVDCVKRTESTSMEMSPGVSSPGHDGRDDILDPDNWLLEPISLSLDHLALPEMHSVPDVQSRDKVDELYGLKQLLQQQSWTPCGVPRSHQNQQ